MDVLYFNSILITAIALNLMFLKIVKINKKVKATPKEVRIPNRVYSRELNFYGSLIALLAAFVVHILFNEFNNLNVESFIAYIVFVLTLIVLGRK